jgi:hypothetical protein
MAKAAISELLGLLDEAFEGEDWHSLVRNLRATRPADWEWVPPEGRRSIREIAGHVGACKFMYENHAFGDATLTWEDSLVAGDGALGDVEAAIAWLQEGHARLRQSVAGLDNGELDRPRRTNWGAMKPTRWIISTMIQHDLYHAGEINHLRALHQGDDQ